MMYHAIPSPGERVPEGRVWNAGSNLAITALYQAFAFCQVSPFHPPTPLPGRGYKRVS